MAQGRSLWARFRDWWLWKPPRRLKITRSGRTYLVITVGVGLGALNTGNNLLYLVLGLLLALIVVSGVLSERCLQQLTVRRQLPQGAWAQEPFPLRYELVKGKGLSIALHLSEESGLETAAFVGVLTAGERVLVRAKAVAPERGPRTLTGVTVSTAFPFGIFEKSRTFEVRDELLVYPRRGMACADPTATGAPLMGDGGPPVRRDGTGDLRGLRELDTGEEARRIHWLKSAAAGKLLKVERDREECRQYLLEVDPRLPKDALEVKCEEAAALTVRLLSRGHEVGLRTGKTRLRPGAGATQERRLLAALAMVGFEPPAEPKP